MSVALLGMEGSVRHQTAMAVQQELIIVITLLAVFLRANYVVYNLIFLETTLLKSILFYL